MVITFEEIKTLVPPEISLSDGRPGPRPETGKRAVAIKNITGNEIFFLGHFPNMAVMPGALIIESMAQTAIILFRKSAEATGRVFDDDQTLFFFGEQGPLSETGGSRRSTADEVTIVKAISIGGVVKAIATVDGQRVAYADSLLAPRARRRCNGLRMSASVPVEVSSLVL